MPTRRHTISSDDHAFQGRLVDLTMPLHLGFESWEQAQEFPDAVYALEVGGRMDHLMQRVESLNVVGEMLWTRRLPRKFKRFPISRYEWLNTIADVFLMRLVSVSDCACLLVNEVYQAGVKPRGCTPGALKKAGVPAEVIDALNAISAGHHALRDERNHRFHHGWERGFSDDDRTFRVTSLAEHRYAGMTGTDGQGHPIDVERYFRDGREELRAEFSPAVKALERDLTTLYDLLEDRFERTFSPLFRARRKPMPWERIP